MARAKRFPTWVANYVCAGASDSPALEAYEADPIATTAFGSFYRDVYLSHKLGEWEQCFYPVSDEQRRKYLTFI